MSNMEVVVKVWMDHTKAPIIMSVDAPPDLQSTWEVAHRTIDYAKEAYKQLQKPTTSVNIWE